MRRWQAVEWAEIEFPKSERICGAIHFAFVMFIFHSIFFVGSAWWLVADERQRQIRVYNNWHRIDGDNDIDDDTFRTMAFVSQMKQKKEKKQHKIDILKVSDWNADDYHQSVSHSVAHVRIPTYLSFREETKSKLKRKMRAHKIYGIRYIMHDHSILMRTKLQCNSCANTQYWNDLDDGTSS